MLVLSSVARPPEADPQPSRHRRGSACTSSRRRRWRRWTTRQAGQAPGRGRAVALQPRRQSRRPAGRDDGADRRARWTRQLARPTQDWRVGRERVSRARIAARSPVRPELVADHRQPAGAQHGRAETPTTRAFAAFQLPYGWDPPHGRDRHGRDRLPRARARRSRRSRAASTARRRSTRRRTRTSRRRCRPPTGVDDIDDLGFELGLGALIAKVELETTSG